MKTPSLGTFLLHRWRPASLALVVAIACGTCFRLARFNESPTRSPDEKTYVSFAGRIASGGLEASRALFAAYEADTAMWSNPPPNRTGFILPAALAMKLAGQTGFAPIVVVSVVATVFSLLLVAVIGIRFFDRVFDRAFDRWVAALATALMATSFTELGTAGRAWQDATFGFFCLGLFWLACECLNSPERRWLQVAFHAAGALCLITKQFSLPFYGTCTLVLMCHLLARRDWKRFIAMALGAGCAGCAAILIWAVAAGGAETGIKVFLHSFMGTAGRDYQERCCSGPWYQLPYTLALMNPVSCALALTGVVSVFLSGSTLAPEASRTARLAAIVAVVFLSFLSFVPRLQSLRFATPVSGILALMGGLGGCQLIWWTRQNFGQRVGQRSTPILAALLAVIVLGAGVREYRVFLNIRNADLGDLGVIPIRRVMGR